MKTLSQVTMYNLPYMFLGFFIIFFSSFSDALSQHAIPAETWIEMRKMYRSKATLTTIEEDIAALAGPDARRAGPRLIDRGPAILSAVHKALLDQDTEPRHAIHLLQVIRAIASPVSVDVLLEVLRKNPDTPLRRDVLLCLALLPATEQSAAYFIDLANNTYEPWSTYRMAFTWFGVHRDSRGRKYAEKLLTNPDPEKKAAGLYVLARLGDSTVVEPVSKILAEGAPPNSRDILMLSLAENVSPEQFIQRAPASLAWSGGYRNSLLYSQYLNAERTKRHSICIDLLRSSFPGHLGEAVRCLLESGHAEDLRPFAALSLEVPGRDALIRNEIRKAGWHIIDTDTEFKIAPGKK